MNTITLGQQHYHWQVNHYPWLKIVACTIYDIAAPQAQLSIVLPQEEQQQCQPKHIANWITMALKQGWKRECRCYRWELRYGATQLLALPNSPQEEDVIIQLLVDYYPDRTPPTALEKSNLVYQWEKVEKKLGFTLPTALQQLYLSLGNGNFGPENGFFLLESIVGSNKMTLLEAYEMLQQAAIADWDWQLPKTALPFLSWGQEIYSIIDTSTPYYSVYVLDKNLKKKQGNWQECYWQHCPSLFEWLEQWAGDQRSARSLWMEMYQLRGLL